MTNATATEKSERMSNDDVWGRIFSFISANVFGGFGRPAIDLSKCQVSFQIFMAELGRVIIISLAGMWHFLGISVSRD